MFPTEYEWPPWIHLFYKDGSVFLCSCVPVQDELCGFKLHASCSCRCNVPVFLRKIRGRFLKKFFCKCSCVPTEYEWPPWIH